MESNYPIIEDFEYLDGTDGYWVILDESDIGSAYTQTELDALLAMLED